MRKSISSILRGSIQRKKMKGETKKSRWENLFPAFWQVWPRKAEKWIFRILGLVDRPGRREGKCPSNWCVSILCTGAATGTGAGTGIGTGTSTGTGTVSGTGTGMPWYWATWFEIWLRHLTQVEQLRLNRLNCPNSSTLQVDSNSTAQRSIRALSLYCSAVEERTYIPRRPFLFFSTNRKPILNTRSQRTLRAPTSRWRPCWTSSFALFGPCDPHRWPTQPTVFWKIDILKGFGRKAKQSKKFRCKSKNLLGRIPKKNQEEIQKKFIKKSKKIMEKPKNLRTKSKKITKKSKTFH